MGFDIQFSTAGLEEISLFATKHDTNILTFTTSLKLDYEKVFPNVHDEKKLIDLKIKIENLLSYYQNRKSELVKLSSVKEYDSIERIIINMKQGLLYQLNVSDQDIYRDKCMAENVNWVINTNPSSKIVLWGHNSHLQKSENSMGEILNKTHAFYSVGFALGNGYFNAIQEKPGREIARSQLLPPITDSYESYFIRTNVSNWFIDLKGLSILENQNQWLLKSHQFRFVGTLLSRYQFAETNLKKDFDGLFFIKDSSPSHLLFLK